MKPHGWHIDTLPTAMLLVPAYFTDITSTFVCHRIIGHLMDMMVVHPD